MKTQFSRRRRLLTPSVQLGGVVLVTIVIILILIRVFIPSFFFALSYPLFALGNATAGISSFFSDRQALTAQVSRLTEERDALTNENNALRVQLSEYGQLPQGGVVAHVTARPPTTPYDVLVIDEGTENAVAVGALVYAKGGVPVGVVADANPTSSRVALFSSAGRSTEGWIGEEKYPVTFAGEGSGAFIAVVPREAPVVEGEMTYFTSSATPFGVVVRVASDASSPQATLHIRPYVSPFSISSVTVGSL